MKQRPEMRRLARHSMVGAEVGGGPEAKNQMGTCCKGRCTGIRIVLSGVQETGDMGTPGVWEKKNKMNT